jgi:signal transduction histidine kinase
VARVARSFNAMTTNLRRTVGELAQRESLASLGEFSASLAHEIRNPLTSVRIDLQRVAEKVPGDSTLSRPLARALGEIQRLDGTVAGVLRLARSGRIDRERVELRIPVKAAAHAAAPEFEEAGAELTIAPADLWKLPVRGDSAALEQLFLNLLLNAAQALEPGGRAVMEVERTGSEAVVSLRDTGTGIPAEELSRVFEPFYSTRSDGTGLGLAIAGRIAAAHGGAIEMESSPGQGTVVRVRIPLDPGREEGAA